MMHPSMRMLAFIALSTLAHTALAGRLDKAFEALRIHDYFKARSLFQGQVKQHPAAAWYGLSVIAGRNDNPFYQLDSAYAFLMRADLAFDRADDRERRSIGRVGVDQVALNDQRAHIFEVAWDLASAENTIGAYDRFLSRFAHSPQAQDAERVRDHLAFQQAREKDSAAAYAEFIAHYPRSQQIYEARSRLQEATYREATSGGGLEEFERFIRDHPDSPYAASAEDEIYRLSTPHRSIQEMHAFILGHPDNHNVPDAWHALYERYTADLSVSAITEFLRAYPDYPFIQELVQDYKVASLVLYPFRRDGRWGFIDEQGVERIKAEYDWVEPFINGQALVGRDQEAGTINKTGKEVVPITYDDVLDFVEGLATVEAHGMAGAVDRNGDLAVPLAFGEVGEFNNGIAYASKDGKYGFIDARGNVVIPFMYDLASSFHHGLAVIEKDGANGVIDTKGELVVPVKYDWIEGFERGVSRVREGGRFGVISPFGDVLLEPVHDHIGAFADDLALVVDKGKCGYADRKGTMVIPQKYEAGEGVATWGEFRGGFAEVRSAGKQGLIDEHDATVIPCQFADVGMMTGPLVPVKKKTKWGYMDRSRTLKVDYKYDLAWELHHGYARVAIGGRTGLIDSTGREVIPPRYRALTDVRGGSCVATTDAGTGLIDLKGEVVLPQVYDAVEPLDDHVFKVERNDRIAYFRPSDRRFIWKEEGFDAEPSSE